MNQKTIRESGMDFVCRPDECFHLEHSQIYKRLGAGIKMAEFAVIRDRKTGERAVWIIEAKSSSPHPENLPSSEAFVRDIRDKFSNALALTVSSVLERHRLNSTEIPDSFKKMDLSSAEFRLILVIKGHNPRWCVDLQNKLARELTHLTKIWALSPQAVVVINDEKARSKYRLIS